MKTKITIFLPLLFALTACSSNGPTLMSHHQASHMTNPANVAMYSHAPKAGSYTSLANVHVSHYNSAGSKRAQGVIDDIMKNDAATLGGNGLINVHHGKAEDTATVIHLAHGNAVEPSYTPV